MMKKIFLICVVAVAVVAAVAVYDYSTSGDSDFERSKKTSEEAVAKAVAAGFVESIETAAKATKVAKAKAPKKAKATKVAKVRKAGPAKAVTEEPRGMVPAESIDTTPRLAGPAKVEVRDGKIFVPANSRFKRVVFFGSYGECLEPLKYVSLNDGEAIIPELSEGCDQFNLITQEGEWAMVGPGTHVPGACVVRETQGPFGGAHAYSLRCGHRVAPN